MKIPIAVSARHAHLSEPTLRKLFGDSFQLHVHQWLSQTGQFAAQETVSLVGPRGRLDGVRLMGPPRQTDQIELSRSDEYQLGVMAPVRDSGDLDDTPGLRVIGPAGSVDLPRGVITARRHIHMNPDEARKLGVVDGQVVSVKVDSDGRDVIFGDVTVRVAPSFNLQLHLDTDEANAAGVTNGHHAELIV
jgi:propanediol utilization protein